MENEIINDLLESERKHKKNIYHQIIGKKFKQRNALKMENSTMIKDIKIDQLSYQDLKALDDEHLKISLDYLYGKCGSTREISKYLNTPHSTFYKMKA